MARYTRDKRPAHDVLPAAEFQEDAESSAACGTMLLEWGASGSARTPQPRECYLRPDGFAMLFDEGYGIEAGVGYPGRPRPTTSALAGRRNVTSYAEAPLGSKTMLHCTIRITLVYPVCKEATCLDLFRLRCI